MHEQPHQGLIMGSFLTSRLLPSPLRRCRPRWPAGELPSRRSLSDATLLHLRKEMAVSQCRTAAPERAGSTQAAAARGLTLQVSSTKQRLELDTSAAGLRGPAPRLPAAGWPQLQPGLQPASLPRGVTQTTNGKEMVRRAGAGSSASRGAAARRRAGSAGSSIGLSTAGAQPRPIHQR